MNSFKKILTGAVVAAAALMIVAVPTKAATLQEEQAWVAAQAAAGMH